MISLNIEKVNISLTNIDFIITNKTNHQADAQPPIDSINDKIYNMLILILQVIIIIGVIGNLLNLVVFGRKNMRQMSTFRFLFYLSAIDLLVLIICATDAVIKFGYQIEIRSHSVILCKFHTFLTYFLTHLSSILLMVISIDRALVIYNKNFLNLFKSKRKNRRRRSRSKRININNIQINKRRRNSNRFIKMISNIHRVDLVVAILVTVLFILNSHYLIFLKLNLTVFSNFDSVPQKHSTNNTSNNFNGSLENSTIEEYICFPLHDGWYKFFLNDLWIWIDFFVYSIIPFVVMGICSYIILTKIRKKSNELFKTLSRTSQSDKSNFHKRLKRNRQLLYMLLITNFYFLISLLPCCLSFLIFRGSETKSIHGQLIVHILLYTNYSFNFLFYGFSSQKYRKEFLALFIKKSKSVNEYID